jgi:RNA polymerase sigma-70 factor, ECF subfamily
VDDVRDVRDSSDSALVFAVARWHHDALEEIYRRHGGAAHAVARHVTRDDGIVADVVQDVFVRLWEQPDRFDPERGSLRAFIIMDTRGRAVDRLRHEGARRRREEREAAPVAATYDDDLEVWDRLLATHLRDALGVLTNDERSAIELAFFGGHTYRDVAVMLGEPEGTVKSRIRSGLHRLRGQLVKQGISGSWLDS